MPQYLKLVVKSSSKAFYENLFPRYFTSPFSHILRHAIIQQQKQRRNISYALKHNNCWLLTSAEKRKKVYWTRHEESHENEKHVKRFDKRNINWCFREHTRIFPSCDVKKFLMVCCDVLMLLKLLFVIFLCGEKVKLST